MYITPRGLQTDLEDFLGSETGPQVLAYAQVHWADEQLAGYPHLLTLAEVAEVLGTDTLGVLSATGAHALPAIEIGTSIRRYLRKDVHTYLQFLGEKPDPALG